MANLHAKLRKIILTDKTLAQFCEEKVKEASKSIRNKGIEKSGYDDYIEAFNDICEDKYLILGDTLFKVIDWKEEDYIFHISNNTDGTVDMIINYHGATHWRDNLDPADIERFIYSN